MSALFENHSCFANILVHNSLPIIKTHEFDFFRCVNVGNWVYNNISNLHKGNLRANDSRGRYSKLFPNEKISYWADSPTTAIAEIKQHGGNKDYITFWAYDDSSSSFPVLNVEEQLVIVNGSDFNFHEILLKIEQNVSLTSKEKNIINLIKEQKPDCLSYESVAKKGQQNFLFFEKGFNKLFLREVKFHLGERKSKYTKIVPCAVTCDYRPCIGSYGKYFEPIIRVKDDPTYKLTDEYKFLKKNYHNR